MTAAASRLIAHLDQIEGNGSGFLPSRTPLITLPEPFAFIAAACEELPARYHGAHRDCRPWLDDLFADRHAGNLIAAAVALDTHTRESLMMKTSLLAHAYRWVGMPTDPANYTITGIGLPPVLEALWSALAQQMGIPRVGIFYTMICHNWRLDGREGGAPYDPAELATERLSIVHSWLAPPERAELQTFILTALMMEAQGATVVRHARRLLLAIERGNVQEATYRLVLLESAIAQIAAAFNQQIRKQSMGLGSFLKLIQPTMVWLLDHGEGPLEGASGPQAVTLQLLDSLLGVPRDSDLGTMILKSRRYMRPDHRALLMVADEARTAVHDFVEGSKDARLREVYNQCLKTLALWRVSHQKRGAMYIAGERGETPASYTSTGLVVQLGADQAGHFQRTMEPHIAATRARAFADPRDGAGFTFAHLMHYLDEETVRLLAARITSRAVPAGTVIIRAGERYPGLFVIDEGEALVLPPDAAPGAAPFATIPVGEIFGEISFVDNLGASADVVAATAVRLSVLTVADIYEMIALKPDIEARLYLSLARVMAQRLRRQLAAQG